MRMWRLAVAVVVLCVAACVSACVAAQAPPAEKAKIEALIKHVEGLAGAKFIRNDKEYDAKTAAKFLRAKWEANDADIKTAMDFIDKAATTSSTSGKPYMIRLKDGKELKSAEYLRAELKNLEQRPR